MENIEVKQKGHWVGLLFLFSLAGLVETFFYGQLSAFTPLYLPKLGITGAGIAHWTGLIAAITGFLGLPFLPFWGALADRYSRKPIIIRSFAVEVISGLIALLAGNIWVFLVGRTLTCLALGNSGLMMTTLSERVPKNRQGLAFSVMNSAPPVGVFLGPLFGGPIVDRWGFQILLGIDVILIMGVVIALSLSYKDHFKGTSTEPLLKMAGDSINTILKSRRLRSLFPALFLLFAGWMLALTYAALAIGQIYHGPNLGTVVGIILGCGGLASLIMGPLIGALADRFGHWRVLMIGAVLAVALWPLPALTNNLVNYGIAWTVLNGVTSGVFALSFTVLAGSTSDIERGRVMSFAFLPVNLGGAIGPAIGSLVTQRSIFAIFPTGAILTAIGVILLVYAYKQSLNHAT